MTRVLDDHLDRLKPEWAADGEVGLLLTGDDSYNPEPDVTVIDRAVAFGQIYADRFYAVVEVLSEHDKAWKLHAKIGYYTRHEHCFAVLFVLQTEIGCRLWRRQLDGSWTQTELAGPNERIALPVIGDIGPLSAFYRDTPLFQPNP